MHTNHEPEWNDEEVKALIEFFGLDGKSKPKSEPEPEPDPDLEAELAAEVEETLRKFFMEEDGASELERKPEVVEALKNFFASAEEPKPESDLAEVVEEALQAFFETKWKPIFLQGICKDYLWGGNRLRTEFGKVSEAEKIAESWELAAHPAGSSILLTGEDAGLDLQQYIDKRGTAFLGTACAEMKTLPVLIKLIDAKEDLSIQVHPDDEYAMRVEGEPGKTEMWYILDAAPGAALYYGLRQEISKEEFAQRIQDQTLPEILNRVEVKPGEVYFIPAGTIHAIGAGILLAEIQQNSNTTYRVYDYGRRGADGKLRELHVEKALDVVNLKPMPAAKQPEIQTRGASSVGRLGLCAYFCAYYFATTEVLHFRANWRSFHHLLVIGGSAVLKTETETYPMQKGDSILIPAGLGSYQVIGDCQMIVTAAGKPDEGLS